MRFGGKFGLLGAVAVLMAAPAAVAAPAEHPRLFVLTDIGNEPDDQMSLVRLLLYANEIDIEGVGAVTSVWQRTKISPEIARGVIGAYGKVLPNLRANAQGWPEASALAAKVTSGVPAYGLGAIDADHPSAAALALIAAAQRPDPRPLWVSLWGGANTLAEALAHARKTMAPTELAAPIAHLRIYAISDQDDAGPWVRREFPDLFWIGTPSTQDGAEYAHATWTGISGDLYYRNGEGADATTVTNAWLDTNIRAKGPMGGAYPRFMFIMEGDTPSYLGLIPNGLASGDHPNWGGWGGRYLLRRPVGEPRAIWTQGGDAFMRVTSQDTVTNSSGAHTSDQATIWRWRIAFQNDFAARMDWTIRPYAQANHPPQVVVDGDAGLAPRIYRLHTGQSATLDASASRDPDGNRLTYHWFPYAEAGFDGTAPNAEIAITNPDSATPTVTALRRCAKAWIDLPQLTCPATRSAHLILAVTDNGTPALTRYRRIIIEVHDDP